MEIKNRVVIFGDAAIQSDDVEGIQVKTIEEDGKPDKAGIEVYLKSGECMLIEERRDAGYEHLLALRDKLEILVQLVYGTTDKDIVKIDKEDLECIEDYYHVKMVEQWGTKHTCASNYGAYRECGSSMITFLSELMNADEHREYISNLASKAM